MVFVLSRTTLLNRQIVSIWSPFYIKRNERVEKEIKKGAEKSLVKIERSVSFFNACCFVRTFACRDGTAHCT